MIKRESGISRRGFLAKASAATLAVGGATALTSAKAAESSAAVVTDATKAFRWRLQHI